MVHFAFADEDTVIQLDSMGPWSLTYVNPKDDPRNKGQRTLRQLEDGRARN
jgi:hypothetical protein